MGLCLLAAMLPGCASSSSVGTQEASTSGMAGALVVDDPWRGLERHEIQLGQKLLVVRGSKGVIGCPYLDIHLFERSGEACAVIPAADTAGMLDSKVVAVTSKARALGIEVGMTGRLALDRIR